MKLERCKETYLSSDEQSARLNAFHGGLDDGITPLHGALALEIDWSRQSFRGSCGNFTAGYGREEFSQRINTCDISSYHCVQGNTPPRPALPTPPPLVSPDPPPPRLLLGLMLPLGRGRTVCLAGTIVDLINLTFQWQFLGWFSSWFSASFSPPFCAQSEKLLSAKLAKQPHCCRVTGSDPSRTCASHQGFQEQENMFISRRTL